jgi:hypothetical protein
MADNITAPGVGAILATDQIGTTHYPRSKTGFGVEGVYIDVSADAPLPVTDEAVADAIATLAAAIGAGSGGGTIGGATETTLAALLAKLPASVGAKAASGSLSIVPATGLDLATNAGLAAALAGQTYYPATQPISATSLPLPVGAATEATIAAVLAKLIAAPATAANQATANTALQNSAPADDLFTITPSDTVALGTIPKALLVTVAGNVAVRGTGASPVTLAVTAGQILPIRARYVYATNTTATVVGLV